MSRAEQAMDRAAKWVLAQEEPEWSPTDQLELERWLNESDGHRTAYLRLCHGWREADRVSALGAGHVGGPRQTPRRAVPRWSIPIGIAAAVMLMIVGTATYRPEIFQSVLRREVAQSHQTPIGVRRTIDLSDGSKVELNTASKVRASLGPEKREVWLDEGEAFFEVAHRNGRPFVVNAGDRRITVLGTKFSVRRQSGKVTVAVLEGRVRVDEIEQGRAVRSSVIIGGDVAIAQGAATLVTARSARKVEDALAWRRGMLSFDQVDLGAITAEFNRYNGRKLIIADPQVAALRIGGMFPSNDPEAFVRLLRDAYGLKIEDTPDGVKISN